MIQNPTNLPDPSEIKMIEEPIVKADIIVPKDYVGAAGAFKQLSLCL